MKIKFTSRFLVVVLGLMTCYPTVDASNQNQKPGSHARQMMAEFVNGSSSKTTSEDFSSDLKRALAESRQSEENRKNRVKQQEDEVEEDEIKRALAESRQSEKDRKKREQGQVTVGDEDEEALIKQVMALSLQEEENSNNRKQWQAMRGEEDTSSDLKIAQAVQEEWNKEPSEEHNVSGTPCSSRMGEYSGQAGRNRHEEEKQQPHRPINGGHQNPQPHPDHENWSTLLKSAAQVVKTGRIENPAEASNAFTHVFKQGCNTIGKVPVEQSTQQLVRNLGNFMNALGNNGQNPR